MNLPVTGREVNYSDSANILSTTDLNGDITYVNPDFIRISGFDEQELLGQHHNVVRHPDMPPEAFADLWSCVRAGRSWMGMVKNRCKNGDHYWVSAFVTPISRDGRVVEYQSVRTKPQPEQVAAAEQLYARLRDKRPPAALRRRPLSVRGRVAALAGVAAGACAGIGGAIAGVSPGAALLLAACAALASGGLAYAALAPLRQLAEQARRLGDNPVGQLVYTGRRDEFGEIGFAMQMLETEAGAMVGRIGDASRQLNRHAHELLAAMDSSTRSASRQQSETDRRAAGRCTPGRAGHAAQPRAGRAERAAGRAGRQLPARHQPAGQRDQRDEHANCSGRGGAERGQRRHQPERREHPQQLGSSRGKRPAQPAERQRRRAAGRQHGDAGPAVLDAAPRPGQPLRHTAAHESDTALGGRLVSASR